MFKFSGTKPLTISPKFFPAVLIVLAAVSCTSRNTIPFPIEESGYAQPVSKPFKFTEPQPLKWITINPDSTKPPKSIPLDIDKLPSKPFTINDFKPLKQPVQVTKLDWDNIPDSAVNLDTIPGKPFDFKKSILPRPVIVRAGIPKLIAGTTSGVLQFSEGEGLPGSKITGSLIDRNGMIWFATERGLCKYTGENLLIYNFVKADPQTNKDYPITHITEDHTGRIWLVTTGDGIYIMDVDNNILLHKDISGWCSDIICDHEGNI